MMLRIAPLLALLFLSGCTATVPLGQSAKYGYVRCNVTYLPPVDFFKNPAPFLPDK